MSSSVAAGVAAEAAAVRAYNHRIVDLSRLAVRIQRERTRLDRKL